MHASMCKLYTHMHVGMCACVHVRALYLHTRVHADMCLYHLCARECVRRRGGH